MPKIVIKEFDNTKAYLGMYTNFAVVVPGFAKTDANCFDENGVYECNNQADFEANVGKIAAGSSKETAVEAKAPTIEKEGEYLKEYRFD
jgi:hypothetical protein